MNVPPFEACLHRKRDPAGAMFVSRFVRKHAFDRGNVPASAPRSEDAVEIEADHGVGTQRTQLVADPNVEPNTGECRLSSGPR